MIIRKRSGEKVPFCRKKVMNAMKKAFDGQETSIDDEKMEEQLSRILIRLPDDDSLTVELVQDEVERALMERGYYDVAKAYILYCEKRTVLRKARVAIAVAVSDPSLEDVLSRIQKAVLCGFHTQGDSSRKEHRKIAGFRWLSCGRTFLHVQSLLRLSDAVFPDFPQDQSRAPDNYHLMGSAYRIAVSRLWSFRLRLVPRIRKFLSYSVKN